MTTLKELGDLLDYILKIMLAVVGILSLVAKWIVRLRPVFGFVLILASLVFPYGFLAWIFMYRAVEMANYLQENSAIFFSLVAQLAGLSILYSLFWSWCAGRFYAKFRGRFESQKQNSQSLIDNNERLG
jgi:hypothetical protein